MADTYRIVVDVTGDLDLYRSVADAVADTAFDITQDAAVSAGPLSDHPVGVLVGREVRGSVEHVSFRVAEESMPQGPWDARYRLVAE